MNITISDDNGIILAELYLENDMQDIEVKARHSVTEYNEVLMLSIISNIESNFEVKETDIS